MTQRYGLAALLIVLGAAWGLTQPLTKIAVRDGAGPLGLIVWQLLIGAVLMGGYLAATGQLRRFSSVQLRFCTVIGVIGTIIPNTTSFAAAYYLPAGVMSIVIASVPMFAFPIALALGNERFSASRFLGLCVGMIGVVILAAPDASLPQAVMIAVLPLALVAPFFYGVEGNVVAKWGTFGLSPVEVMFGASAVGLLIAIPLAVLSGQWVSPLPPYGSVQGALVLSSVIHAVVYTTYVWLIGRAGAVFASQVAYLVTGFGVVWSMLMLGERYSGWVWVALVFMFVGLALVQPRKRRKAPLA